MRFCLTYLQTLVDVNPDHENIARALKGAELLVQALDGLTAMLRMLPPETQQRMAQDLYEIATQRQGELH